MVSNKKKNMSFGGPVMQHKKNICREIISELLKQKKSSHKDVEKIAKKICKKYDSPDIPANVQILQFCNSEEKRQLKSALLMKPVRTISGVTIITVSSKPVRCPGRCLYCPKGENAPQSYTGLEPAIQRAINNKYDPFFQVTNRLEQYKLMGHEMDKVELIIIGSTFLAHDKPYQEWFVCRLYDALNGSQSRSLEEAIKTNETAALRCSGLTIETRADYCFEQHINQLLRFGTTRVEVGVQSLQQNVLEKINRMHDLNAVIKATQLAKDSGLKCTYHMMPGLFSSPEEDLEQYKILFSNPQFKPDSLKIYPTLVIKGTQLYNMWKAGQYTPLNDEEATDLIAKAMKYIPKYCRIIRVQRDIPSNQIEAGVKKSNLRELVEQRARKLGIKIQDIRYREAGHAAERGIKIDYGNVKMRRLDYDASGGKEIFLSFEDTKHDVLIGFLRLRIPFKPFRPEITSSTALIRELHVYGPLVPVGEHNEEALQHKGFGAKLLQRAEKIAKDEFKAKKMVIISGVGIRGYYYRFGYIQDGPYVSKILK